MIPEKWRIKITKENQHIVGEYYDKVTGEHGCYTKPVSLNSYVSSHNSMNDLVINGVGLSASFYCGTASPLPEITLEQFQQLIEGSLNLSYEIY